VVVDVGFGLLGFGLLGFGLLGSVNRRADVCGGFRIYKDDKKTIYK